MQTSRPGAAAALLGLSAALLSLAAAQPASAQTHVYTLNNTYADSNGGPSLVPNGSTGTGTLSASGYNFTANQGLGLTNALTNPGNYSISLTFSLTDISGYKKLIDFKNLASDKWAVRPERRPGLLQLRQRPRRHRGKPTGDSDPDT